MNDTNTTMEEKELGEAIKKISKMIAMNLPNRAFVETASGYMLAYQELQRRKYVENLQQRIEEFPSIIAEERRLAQREILKELLKTKEKSGKYEEEETYYFVLESSIKDIAKSVGISLTEEDNK